MISQREGKGEPSILSRSMGGHGIDSHPDEELIKDVTWVAYTGALMVPGSAAYNRGLGIY